MLGILSGSEGLGVRQLLLGLEQARQVLLGKLHLDLCLAILLLARFKQPVEIAIEELVVRVVPTAIGLLLL